MSGTKSTAPETLEELRAALRRWVDGTRSYADHVERDAGAYQDAVWRIAIHRDAANQIAALLPEPIKVGDRVQFVDNPRTGTLVAVDEWEAWVRWDVGARTQVAFERLRRVDSSPSPEPETGHEFVGVNGHPDDDECTYRVDGTDDTYCGRTAAEHRDPHCTICGVGSDPGGDHVACRYPDPAPSPSPEVGEGVEPHESEDPEELAAAVAAGLTVNPRPPGADWRDRQTYDGTVSAFREALDYGFRYRIHGTVPGYGETGGAS